MFSRLALNSYIYIYCDKLQVMKMNMKKSVFIILMTICVVLCAVIAGKNIRMVNHKNVEEIEEENDDILIGFSQLGAESAFRSANTTSMKETFTEEKGYQLFVEDGQQKQENQIMAIRTFIQQEVDYIVLAPVTETGWDTVLQEARDAGIPVIIMDRRVNVSDESLYTCWVGSDFGLEGKKMAEWIHQFTLKREIPPEEVRIVNIQGTIGATAQIGRTRGLYKAAKDYGWNILAEESGEFTQAKGKEVMQSFLEEYPELNIVYCENDNEAFGAIEAIKEAGRTIGTDILNGEIMVVSFDGVDVDALSCVADGEISCIAECNPLHGPWVEEIIQMMEMGKTPPKYTYVDEEMYSNEGIVSSITLNGSSYMIRQVNSELLVEYENRK